MKNVKNESLILALLAYVVLDLLAHWHPGLRSSFEFLPREAGGDVNEFVTLWVAEFSRNVREGGFRASLYWVNPWSAGGYYTSHPGLLTFVTALWQNMFGESPDTLRRLAILLFSLRLGFLHALVARTFGIAVARVALLFYLLVPTTQTYTHALSFEVISGTFVLGAFWAKRWWAGAAFMALAGLTDWTALLALPVFLWFSQKKFPSLWFIAVPIATQFWWAKLTGGAGDGQLSRLYMYLIGPYHVLRSNHEAVEMLWRALLMSFPVPVVLFFLFDLYKHGIKRREPWFYACLFAGCAFLVMFLGVFRVHPYASQLLVLPLCAAGARGYWEFFERPYRRWSGLAMLVAMGLYCNAYPFQTREMAERRAAFRAEAEEIAVEIKGSTYLLKRDSISFRPEPLPIYLSSAKQRKAGCPDFQISDSAVSGQYLELKKNSCAP